MILELSQHPGGVTTEEGDRVVYDVEHDEAHYGAATVEGHALVWELTERPGGAGTVGGAWSRAAPAGSIQSGSSAPGAGTGGGAWSRAAPAGSIQSGSSAPGGDWLVRCDRVDFPPGGIAYRHTHPGPGLRVLLHGSIRIETQGESHEYGPLDWWYETGPDPVFAAASETEDTAFVRVMVLPAEWAGKRTIAYVDPADEEKPKLQRARIYLEHPL